jgi:hypothetical protein
MKNYLEHLVLNFCKCLSFGFYNGGIGGSNRVCVVLPICKSELVNQDEYGKRTISFGKGYSGHYRVSKQTLKMLSRLPILLPNFVLTIYSSILLHAIVRWMTLGVR